MRTAKASKAPGSAPRLGRGLAALFGDQPPAPAAAPGEARERAASGRTTLPITLLEPGPFQPRMTMDAGALDELVASIRQQGVLQPLLARPHPTTAGMHQIIAGERRWRAAGAAGLAEVPVLVRPLSDADAMAAALVENLQRQDLDAIEEAEGYRRLLHEFGVTQERLGEAVGKSRSHVTNTVRLLQLPQGVRDQVRSGALTAGHARALLAHPDPEAAARLVVAQGLNVRQTEALAGREGRTDNGADPERPAAADSGAAETAASRELSARLGLRVQVASRGRGGSIRIHYQSREQLDSLIARLGRD